MSTLIDFVSFSPVHTTTIIKREATWNHWILTVEWAGAQSCLFGWRHCFQMASFSPSTLENSVFKKHRFQITPLWRAFSNESVSGDRFRRCSVDDSRIRSKPAPFSPSTRIRIFSNPQLFLSGYGYRPHVSGEFDSESGKKINLLSRVEKNISATNPITCGRGQSG